MMDDDGGGRFGGEHARVLALVVTSFVDSFVESFMELCSLKPLLECGEEERLLCSSSST